MVAEGVALSIGCDQTLLNSETLGAQAPPTRRPTHLVGVVLSSSDSRNHTKSAYPIFPPFGFRPLWVGVAGAGSE